MVMRFKAILPIAAILICCFGGQAFAAPVDVACGPWQHAVVHHTWVRGQPVARVVCVGSTYRAPAYSGTRYYASGYYGPHYYYRPRYYHHTRYAYRTRYYHGHPYRVRVVVRF